MCIVSIIHTHTHTHTLLVAKPCPTLCHPKDCSPPGSSPWISQGQKHTYIIYRDFGLASPTRLAQQGLHCTARACALLAYVTHTHMYLCNRLSRAAYTLRAVFCWGLPGLPNSFPHGNSPSSFSVSGVWEGWLPRAHPGFEVTRKPGMLLDHGKNPFCGGGQVRRMFSATKNAKLGADWCPPHPGLDSPLELSVPGSNVPFLAKPV